MIWRLVCGIFGHPTPCEFAVDGEDIDSRCRRCGEPIYWFGGRWW